MWFVTDSEHIPKVLEAELELWEPVLVYGI